MIKIKLSHWELLLTIYQHQLGKTRLSEDRCHKGLLKTFYKNNWVSKLDDNTLIVTNEGIEAAKEITQLYERDSEGIGQTF